MPSGRGAETNVSRGEAKKPAAKPNVGPWKGKLGPAPKAPPSRTFSQSLSSATKQNYKTIEASARVRAQNPKKYGLEAGTKPQKPTLFQKAIGAVGHLIDKEAGGSRRHLGQRTEGCPGCDDGQIQRAY